MSQVNYDYVEFRLRNTWHCWIIKKEPALFELRYPYTIYHKHKPTVELAEFIEDVVPDIEKEDVTDIVVDTSDFLKDIKAHK